MDSAKIDYRAAVAEIRKSDAIGDHAVDLEFTREPEALVRNRVSSRQRVEVVVFSADKDRKNSGSARSSTGPKERLLLRVADVSGVVLVRPSKELQEPRRVDGVLHVALPALLPDRRRRRVEVAHDLWRDHGDARVRVPVRGSNVFNTFNELLKLGVVTIVNENDTVRRVGPRSLIS